MRIDVLAQHQLLKLPAYEKLLKKLRVSDEHVCVISDDLMELPILRRAGFAVAVSNAVDEVKQTAHYITRKTGGRGAVREVVELILRAKGLWDNVLNRYQ
jgi:3-deoxy-D-manno-octulosonate 8-phosphate phosphatase (KDO 8-P phosphatase)